MIWDIKSKNNFSCEFVEIENDKPFVSVLWENNYNKFNKQINRNNLGNINCLFLGENFNLPLDNLPETLLSLTITGKYRQPLDNLPSNLSTNCTIVTSQQGNSIDGNSVWIQKRELTSRINTDETFTQLSFSKSTISL